VSKLPATRLVRASSLYESEPWGDAETWFVNGVIEVETEAEPRVLLEGLQSVEEAMGRRRVPGDHWGSRIIDLDILLWDRETIDAPALTVPHPEMHKRRFVLVPLAELAPDAVHPVLGQTIAALLATVRDDKRVVLLPST
jgi:2-amino-4-hydroxy-6-hydroxymethyldihydropteridine diphosphokinase